MPPIVSGIEIAGPPDEVFAYATDPSRFAEWQRDVVRVRIEGDRPPGVGSRFTTTRRVGGAERTMTQEITDCRAPRSWAARGVDGPIAPGPGAQPSLVRARRRLRTPWPMRWGFSMRAKRTWPSPPGPKPMPGEVATLASLTSMEANSTEPSSR
jgi:uncharacterized protein YndB with AHSA1/START domain